jgi:transketolase
MRDAFSKALLQLAKTDRNVVLLTGDHGYALFDEFRQQCPDQYINAGIAEQNMVGMAAGLARTGFRPFVYGLSAFVPVRVLEQIKLDIAHDDLPVVLLGDGAGFVYSHLGTSHQSTEDMACTRAIAGLTVLSPADRFEMAACMSHAYASKSPVYLRMGKADLGDVHKEPLQMDHTGRVHKVRNGSVNGVAILATGSMVTMALKAIELSGLDCALYSVPSIKPLSADDLAQIADQSKALITVEEHSIIGGLGAAVLEILSETHPRQLLRLGVADRYSKYCGKYDYLLKEHGLDLVTMTENIKRFVQSV